MTKFPTAILCETSTVQDDTMSFKAGDEDLILQNRKHFLEKNGVAVEQCIPMCCDHGEKIVIVDENTTLKHYKGIPAEVLITQKRGTALFLLTADCIPLSLYDPKTETIALVHISRKTFVQQLVQKTLGFLHTTFGVEPANLLIHLGPHIKKESYAFSLPLQEESKELIEYTEIRDSYAHIDLEKGSLAHLTHAGVLLEHITVSPIDTGSSSEHFSYFRAKKEARDTTLRIATVLMMK